MRLRGFVFERFQPFERAEVNLCDENGAPLDVILFVGESASGKTALLRGVVALLGEAAGAAAEVGEHDVKRTADRARCRVVFDDMVEGGRIVITLEKELARTGPVPPLRGSPVGAFERWQAAVTTEEAPRAAFSMTAARDDGDDDDGDEDDDSDDTDDELALFVWFGALENGPKWKASVAALDRVLWPYRFAFVDDAGELHFVNGNVTAPSGELGDAFESVLVMALELLRLSTERPNDELVYVIDDIDAHLHPRWQSRILGNLRRAFPRVQLVATTHSPHVVASVEPSQVFRITSGEGGGSLTRISDRLQKGSHVSSVMDIAFGAPDLPGPRWAHTPPLALRREVLAAIDGDLGPGAVVYVLPEPIHVRDVLDAFGEPALPIADSSMGDLFFIDREPGVPWGHPCEFVFRSREGQLSRHRAIWPPKNLERFVPIGRG